MAGYGIDEGFAAWMVENGYDLPPGRPLALLRQRGSSYLDAKYGARFPGLPTGGLGQERAFPRTGAVIFGTEVGPDEIPLAVIHASYAAAAQEGMNLGSLSVSRDGASSVKRVKIDVIEREFFEPTATTAIDALPTFSDVEGLIASCLRPAAGGALFGSAVRS